MRVGGGGGGGMKGRREGGKRNEDGGGIIMFLMHSCTASARPPLSDSNPVKRLKTTSTESPRQFFIGHLLTHRGSLWKHSLEEAVLPQWERCVEYFDLCNLLHETKCK